MHFSLRPRGHISHVPLLLLLLVGVLSPVAVAWQQSIPGISFSHAVGSAVSGTEAWSVTPSSNRDFAIYGAYSTNAPTSTQICAHFYIAIDDVTVDNLGVARLDLANNGIFINYRYLLRSEFVAANVTQVFRVCGTTPSSSAMLEARVYSVGELEPFAAADETTFCDCRHRHCRGRQQVDLLPHDRCLVSMLRLPLPL